MIHEINHLKELEVNTGVKIPMPNFFYIEKYGRKLEDQMEELLPVLGKKEWFLFKTDCRFKEGGLLHNFIIELEKHAKLGKDYDECILVELTEDIQLNEEFPEFLYYLKSQEEKIYFIFTMKHSKDTAFIQECMEQYFFIRDIYAKEYSAHEQWDIIQKICREFEFGISTEAKEILISGLKEREWKPEEQVMCRLKNNICSQIYELLLTEESEKVIQQETAENILRKIEPVQKKRHTIGFCQGGLTYE